MSNTDVPAAASGGGTTTSAANKRSAAANAAADRLPEDLPDRIRVHALAKLLGVTSKDVLATLTEVGNPARGAQSNVDRDIALRVAAALLPEPPEPTVDDADDIDGIGDVALNAPLTPVFAPQQPLFMPPQPLPLPDAGTDEDAEAEPDQADAEEADAGAGRRRRRRGRRGRGRGKGAADGEVAVDADLDANGYDQADHDDQADQAEQAGRPDQAVEPEADEDAEDTDQEPESAATRRRRRRRRRKGVAEEEAPREDDPPNTVVHVRDSRPAARAAESDDGVQGVKGSTRLEAKRQRRRDGREAGRRRAPILSEAEFLARRESVDRTMIVREYGRQGKSGDGASVQIGVLEDGVLVEHFVTSAGSGSLVGNVYLGRVQNVLPSMEAAFVDIGRGRNAVLYAGEVDWDAAGLEGKARKIEQALNTGDSVLVQVTKDPVGHKGARLTTQISLPGRFLVYVPGGGATGISRKLPDTERRRLKDILKRIVPEDAGVIIRTASEGISEEALARDVRRLQAQWEVIKSRAEGGDGGGKATAPQLLYEEPDLLIKVVRDLFTEDFAALVVQGVDAWDTIEAYVKHVAPDLASRLRRHVGPADVFSEYRIDEQITKALDRKVWLPSGGYLVIDRTEAMTVIDVNTGKFTGSGGNLEETVTRNNLEAAEEIVRQLRLRDIGGIIVIDFIDMVLESNRDLVLRRLTECLGRDRTRHQVAEVTSLGLVQMTRKRVGTGLLEAYSQPCEHCRGRGVVVTTEPVERPVTSVEPAPVRRTRPRGKAAQVAASEPRAEPPAEKPTTETKTAAKAAPKVAVSRAERRKAAAAAAAEPPSAPAAEPPSAPAAEPPTGTAAQQAAGREPVAAEEAPAAVAITGRQAGPSVEPAAAEGGPVAGPAAGREPLPTEPAVAASSAAGPAGAPRAADEPAASPPAAGPAGTGWTGGPPAAESPVSTEAPDGAAARAGEPSPDGADGVSADKAGAARRGRRRRAASRPAGPPVPGEVSQAG